MPRIPVYSNEVYPNASPVADQARSAATAGYYRANTIRQGFNALEQGVNQAQGDYERRQKEAEDKKAQQEIIDLSVKMAMNQADLAVKWSQVDKSDPNAAQTFMDNEVTPAYDGLGEGLTTQKAKDHFAINRANGWGNFYQTTAADQATADAQKAVASVQAIGTNLSDASFVDPSSMRANIQLSDNSVDAIAASHGLTVAQTNELKQSHRLEIAKSTALGMIQLNPQAALDALKKGEFIGLLDGTELAAMTDRAKAAIVTKDNNDRSNIIAERKQRKDIADAQLGDIVGTIKAVPGSLKSDVPKDYYKMIDKWRVDNRDVDGAEEKYRIAYNFAKTEESRNPDDPDFVTDKPTETRLIERAKTGDLTHDEVMVARSSGYLSKPSFDFLDGLVREPAKITELKTTETFLDGQEGFFRLPDAGSIGFGETSSAWAKAAFADYKSDMLRMATEARRLGWSDDKIEAYARTALAGYQFDAKRVKAAVKAAGGVVPSYPNVNPPPLVEGKRPPISDLFIKSSYEGGTDIPSTISPVGKTLPIVARSIAGRQPVNMSGLKSDVADKFSRLQGELGYQITVVSAFRDPTTNALAGGAKKSQHMHGNAIDLDVSKLGIPERQRIIRTARALGFKGIGVYPNSIHLDIGGLRAWGPSHHSDSIPKWALTSLGLGQDV